MTNTWTESASAAELAKELARQTERADMWKKRADELWKRIKNAQDSLED